MDTGDSGAMIVAIVLVRKIHLDCFHSLLLNSWVNIIIVVFVVQDFHKVFLTTTMTTTHVHMHHPLGLGI